MNENELKHLMSATLFNNIFSLENWSNLDKAIKDPAKKESVKSTFDDISIYYAWSARTIICPSPQITMIELLNDPVMSLFISAELSIQANWMLLDCCTDNLNVKKRYNMKDIQLLSNLVEISHAELVNETHTSMSTVHKEIMQNVYTVSDMQQLFSSVILQLQLHQKLKKTIDDEKKNRNKFFVDLFMAIFSASTLYKTISELIRQDFNWSNLLLFGALLIVSIGIIVFNYKNR